MQTCHRLYYVSQVCLRLLRKYTNEIYPNDISKTEKIQSKKRSSDTDDKNDAHICELFLIHSKFFYFILREHNTYFMTFIFRWNEPKCICISKAKASNETNDVK